MTAGSLPRASRGHRPRVRPRVRSRMANVTAKDSCVRPAPSEPLQTESLRPHGPRRRPWWDFQRSEGFSEDTEPRRGPHARQMGPSRAIRACRGREKGESGAASTDLATTRALRSSVHDQRKGAKVYLARARRRRGKIVGGGNFHTFLPLGRRLAGLAAGRAGRACRPPPMASVALATASRVRR